MLKHETAVSTSRAEEPPYLAWISLFVGKMREPNSPDHPTCVRRMNCNPFAAIWQTDNAAADKEWWDILAVTHDAVSSLFRHTGTRAYQQLTTGNDSI